jgi:hypothetical protein
MTKDELFEVIEYNTVTLSHQRAIKTAVEAYSSASNGSKPDVSGALPPESAFYEALEKEAFRVPYDGSNNFYDEKTIKHWEKCWEWVRSWRQ